MDREKIYPNKLDLQFKIINQEMMLPSQDSKVIPEDLMNKLNFISYQHHRYDHHITIIGTSQKYPNPITVKIFPYQEKQMHPNYKEESRFSRLLHSNIIKTLEKDDKIFFNLGDSDVIGSCLIYEQPLFGWDEILELTQTDQTLLRTLFHHLLAGIGYLHSKGISHLHLKPENIFMGRDNNFKLGNIDRPYHLCVEKIITTGEINFRAPEIVDGTCADAFKADIYSIAILLFFFKTGVTPYQEENREDLLRFEDKSYIWEKMKKIGIIDFSDDFQELFIGMTLKDPQSRITIDQIKKMNWYNYETYSSDDIKLLFKNMKNF